MILMEYFTYKKGLNIFLTALQKDDQNNRRIIQASQGGITFHSDPVKWYLWHISNGMQCTFSF